MRVYRHDTGRDHEVPGDYIRWGPETGQGTCRTGLLRAQPATIDVPYILPFPGAKWAVRVTPRPDAPPAPAVIPGITCAPIKSDVDRRKLGELLAAAAASLRADFDIAFSDLRDAAESARRAQLARWTESPDALGEALELLAACLPLVEELRSRVGDETARRRMASLLRSGHDLLEREAAAEIRRAYGERLPKAAERG